MPDSLASDKSIFLEAIEISSPAERAAYLDQACGDRRALRAEVEDLLRAHLRPQGLLDAENRVSLAAHDLAAQEAPGTMIGPYKLLEQIGEGGMGLVFMADQTQPVRRKVALKVLKPGMDTRQVVARFEAERQALAIMDHPNIARIHDGGVTPAGRLYFVMELVRGVPITEFCDQHRFTTRQRLELFVTVCHAVQHAHQKGIIHRDLKPNNILVTLHDVVAVPKIIDFGIAKATTQPLTDRSLFTHFSQIIGTPLYMSPEQAEMNGLDVDTRSDVYSLGVLLYELLTGTTPFESERLKQVGFDEMRRVIREEEPPRPSQRVSTLDVSARSTISERRGTDVRTFASTLRGELDWIVLKALEKDRSRRYESVSAFAADVAHYLRDEPVEACPPSAAYRLKKLVRRHRRAMVTAAILLNVLVSATVVSVWQAITAREAQHQAEQSELRATNEAAIARAVRDFLQKDLLAQAAGEAAPGEVFEGAPHLTVKMALDRATARIGDRFKDQPLVEAEIRLTVGKAYRSLDEFSLAVPHLQRATALRKAHLGDAHPDTVESMRAWGDALFFVGPLQEVVAVQQTVFETQKALFGADHPKTLSSRFSLIHSLHRAGQLDWHTKVRILEQLLDKQREICGPTHPATLGTMHRLAVDYIWVGRFAESLDFHEKLLASANGDTNWYVLTYSQACQYAGKLDHAEHLLQRLFKINEARPDSFGSRSQRATLCGWMARTLHLQNRDTEAESFAREAVARYEKDLPDDFRHSYWVSLLGAIYMGQKEFIKAEPLLLEGYKGMKRGDDLIVAETAIRMAEVGERLVRFYELTQQPEKAREWREKLDREVPKEKPTTSGR
jgi:serine/threonine protein kinase/tetratricopeptide (TPR) repeat protein